MAKNKSVTFFSGQGNANRSARANSVAKNTSKNPNLVIREGEASVELGGDTSSGETTGDTASTYVVNGQSEFIWYYHPDHLGSTGFVTDANGELYEHVEYFPFGETWVQEHSNTQRTPYLYTGKELDEETGLYYFGARYYDPRTSVWQSADPIIGEYLAGQPNGGVFKSSTLALYSYVSNRPLIHIDPDGLAEILIDPGHGDHHSKNSKVDVGAIGKQNGSDIYEKDMALTFSIALGAELEKHGHSVSYTRAADVDNTKLKRLKWRVDIANDKDPDLFISVHLDVSTNAKASGLSVYANKEGSKAKKEIEKSVSSIGVRKPADKKLGVLKQDRAAILLEAGFITNSGDVKVIQGDGKANPALAKEVASGINNALKE